MTTITVPIDSKLNKFLNDQVKSGKVSSKAFFVREAIKRYKQEIFIQEIMEAKGQKSLRGNLDELAKIF